MTAGLKKYSTYAKTALQDLDSLGWNTASRPDVAYIGWLGRGNLGDEVMFLSHRQRLTSSQRLAKAPINGWSRRLASLTRRPAADTLLVGGGTLLGHTGWLKSIIEARALLAPRRFVVLGAGMEDIEFALDKGLATKQTLREWTILLNEADYVGVRGPRSQQHLSRIGVDSEVVGDAALWFTGSRPLRDTVSSSRRSPYIAINIVGGSNGFDSDHYERRRAIVKYVRRLDQLGLGVIFFGMERRDLYEARQVQKSMPRAEIMKWTASANHVVDLIKGSELVVAERLHGAILAASSSVPFLMLAYKPKSYDFAESVKAVDSCIAPDAFSAEILMERTLALMSEEGRPRGVDGAKATLGRRFDAAHATWVRVP